MELAGSGEEFHGRNEGFQGYRLCEHGKPSPYLQLYDVFDWDAHLPAKVMVYQVCTLQYRKLDFEEFAASAISVYQMEALETWEQHARRAYELFDKEGNRPIVIEELASVRV